MWWLGMQLATNSQRLDQRSYLILYIEVARILFKQQGLALPLGKVKATAVKEWQQEAHGQPRLTKNLFTAAIFQLADIWSGAFQERDFGIFLDEMLYEVLARVQERLKSRPISAI
ncbi:hypothetical protein CYMTET_44796, partial [Cymbomonas tetramitiformis]